MTESVSHFLDSALAIVLGVIGWMIKKLTDRLENDERRLTKIEVEAAFTAEGLNASEYGLFCSDTFEDEDGNSVTRLGIRYEELLAFIISVM